MGILGFLVPREEKFFDMLRDQTDNVLDGIKVFNEFVSKFDNISGEERENYVHQIREIEHRGDRITHAIADKLNESFITPIDKEDLHHLTMLLDDVLDLVNVTSRQLIMYKLKKLESFISKFGVMLGEGMNEVADAVHSLRSMKYSQHSIIRINQLENEGDELFRTVIADLFSDGKDPVKIIKLKDICTNLELATDKIEDVAVVIDNIVIKHG